MNAVDIGIAYEKKVVGILESHGLKAWRTNVTNEYDPENYKHGYDGGVDIIAKYSVANSKPYKEYIFFIQCKCWKKDLTKQAISEVYAGMHARNGFGKACIPVVFATCNATKETRQYAKQLGVELILNEDMELIKHARVTGTVAYADYGILMKIMLYKHTNDRALIDYLPDTASDLSTISLKDQLYNQTLSDLNEIQAEWDEITNKEMRLQQQRQKMLDRTKMTVLRNIQSVASLREHTTKNKNREKTTINLDSG